MTKRRRFHTKNKEPHKHKNHYALDPSIRDAMNKAARAADISVKDAEKFLKHGGDGSITQEQKQLFITGIGGAKEYKVIREKLSKQLAYKPK